MLNKTQRPCKRLHLWRTREGPETVGGEASGPTVSNLRIVSLRYRLIHKWLATLQSSGKKRRGNDLYLRGLYDHPPIRHPPKEAGAVLV